jgi:prevent-host-death family protein
MEQPREVIAIGRFKATCLAVLERVRRTGQPILVTRRGMPVAEIFPPPKPHLPEGWLGDLRGTGVILGDIVGPAADPDDWDVLGP